MYANRRVVLPQIKEKKKKKEGDYSCSLFFLRNPLPVNKISTFKSECKQVKDKEKAR